MMKRQYPQLKESDIMRKLEQSGVRNEQQYGQIVQNLTHQNQRLARDLQLLRQKVAQLKQKQKRKISQIKKDKQRPQNVYQDTKVELQKRYHDFQVLRKKIARKMGAEPMLLQFKEYMNKCSAMDAQIIEMRAQLRDVRKQKKSINKGMKSQKKQISLNMTSVDSLEDDNREMKKRVWQLRRTTDQQQSEIVKIQSFLIGNRQKIRQKNQFVMSISELKESRTLDRAQIFRQQVQSHRLKTQMGQQKGRISSQKQLNKQKQIVSNKNKLLLRSLKGMESTKANLLLQMNELVVQLEPQFKGFASSFCQTEIESIEENTKYVDEEPLRREQFGRQGMVTFDDRDLLEAEKKTCITGLMVYLTERGLSCIRAIYSNGKITPQTLPEDYLNRITVQKLQLSPGDYINTLAIKFHVKQRRIVAFKVISNQDQNCDFGPPNSNFNDQDEDQQIFVYDIDTNEWPSCLFGSSTKVGPHWLLTSLGIEIAQGSN